ncbi:MAG: NUDIX domain-containing protein [Desulfobacteraceae bacterium]|nr:MAG: NUDIX domain-containing protein [Desulfobacteraceae bacterium]
MGPFTYCPRCGSASLLPSSVKQFTCSDCEFTFFMNTASSAAALILTPDQRLLATRRKYDPAKGTLDLPGGFADPHETIEACIKREVKEELNLNIRALEYGGSLPNTYYYKDVLYHTIDMIFRCRVDDFSCIQARDDISSYEFIPVEQLDPEAFGLDSIRRVIRKFADQFGHGSR